MDLWSPILNPFHLGFQIFTEILMTRNEIGYLAAILKQYIFWSNYTIDLAP